MKEDTKDDDPDNMLVRAGYLRGLATKHEGEDKEMLLRASRSLMYASRNLQAKPRRLPPPADLPLPTPLRKPPSK